MTTTTKTNMTNGTWSFDDRIGEATLVKLAEEWTKGPDGSRFKSLAIRGCGRNQIGIWFTYIRKDSSRESQNEFVNRIAAQLSSRFGFRYLGYNISSRMTIVK